MYYILRQNTKVNFKIQIILFPFESYKTNIIYYILRENSITEINVEDNKY